MHVLYSQNKTASASAGPSRSYRHIPSAPERILDAPDLLDDYYLNIMDWGDSNFLAIGLTQTVYLWNAATGEIIELMYAAHTHLSSPASTPKSHPPPSSLSCPHRSVTDTDDYITSVSWIQDTGSHLAIGTASAETQLWDVGAQKMVRSMGGHTGRVGALSWNRHVLSSGSRDSTIVHHDVRVQNHHIATLAGHEQEVCGLSWYVHPPSPHRPIPAPPNDESLCPLCRSPDGTILASGGNDNVLCLWDGSSMAGPRAAQPVAPRSVLTEHQVRTIPHPIKAI